jgi:tRNA dimethylallyltransferase
MLQRMDPEAATRISPNDRQKLVRALEVCLLAGRPLTSVLAAGRSRLQGYRTIKIGLQPSRGQLYARIGERVQAMLESGWREEVETVLKSGVPPCARPFEFIGYRELIGNRETGAFQQDVGQAIAKATRNYAKRQMTWFRKESSVKWIPGFGDDPDTVREADALLEQFLAAGNLESAEA